MTEAPLIALRNVGKSYETAAGSCLALRDIDLEIAKGAFVAILGKSGSGKSTLLHLIGGIDRPSHGEVVVGAELVHQSSEDALARWRGRNVGVVFQFFQLLPTLTVLENVMLPMDFAGRGSAKERHERAMALLADVDMADQANKLPLSTSGGQQQRVAIARAFLSNPEVLILDEPSAALDSAREEELLANLRREFSGKTLIAITHKPLLASMADYVLRIEDGRVIESSSRENAFAKNGVAVCS
jgi:putative ABC transport system ATP-binding protein